MAEGARLESVFRVKPNEGSNPSLSAKYKEPALRRFFCASFAGQKKRNSREVSFFW